MRIKRNNLTEKDKKSIINLVAYGWPIYKIQAKFKLRSPESIYKLLRVQSDVVSEGASG